MLDSEMPEATWRLSSGDCLRVCLKLTRSDSAEETQVARTSIEGFMTTIKKAKEVCLEGEIKRKEREPKGE
jgi:hypothetical protein